MAQIGGISKLLKYPKFLVSLITLGYEPPDYSLYSLITTKVFCLSKVSDFQCNLTGSVKRPLYKAGRFISEADKNRLMVKE